MKHVLVTGGARGIGRAIVEELAGDYKVTATYNGSARGVEEIIKEFPNVQFIRVDLQDRRALDEFVAKSTEPIDVLVNNAGVWTGKPFVKMTEAELYQQSDLNFTAPARLMQGLLPQLEKAASPQIINISSHAANDKNTGEAMYSASKAALSALSHVLRAELNPGVRVTTIEPFGVNTYGLPEPSDLLLPSDLAKTIRYVIELPDHIQLDTVVISHANQARPGYPEWIEP